jgi:hypothetical protein
MQPLSSLTSNNDQTLNQGPCSRCDRITSLLASPFRYLATSIANLAWRPLDPTWRAFLVNGQGHFVKTKHEEAFDLAVARMDQIFNRGIKSADRDKEWHYVHENNSSRRIIGQLWQQFSKQYGGTCFGNSVTLASHILQSDRILSIEELAELESQQIFIPTAQSVQLVANSAVEYNKTIKEADVFLKPKKPIDRAERLASLAITSEDYLKSKFKDHLDALIVSGLEKDELGDETIETLIRQHPFWFAKKLNYLVMAKEMLRPALQLIKPFNLLPTENLEEVKKIQVDKFQRIANSELDPATFKGIMLINGIGKNNIGHTMLLEIDNQAKQYLFYDNNRGYYQWKDLSNCLSDLEKRFVHENFESCEVILGKIES